MKTRFFITVLVSLIIGSSSCINDPAGGQKLLPGKEKVIVPKPNVVTPDTTSNMLPAVIDSNKRLVNEHAGSGQ